jgi:hypothetical protein
VNPGESLHLMLNLWHAKYAPEYGQDLTNHLPMLLHALHELGAPPQRLREVAARYSEKLRTRAPALVETHAPCEAGVKWQSHLGSIEAFELLLRHFTTSVKQSGIERAVADALPALMPGVAAAALHGLIRTAHAVSAGHAREVAWGLAYWAARHQRLVPADALVAPAKSLQEWFDDALALRAQGSAGQGLISHRMAVWAARPDFPRVAAGLLVDPETPSELARIAAGIYARTCDFTVLHAITSSHAMTVLAALQPDPIVAVRWFSIAFAGALCAAQSVDLTEPEPEERRPWPEIITAAVASDDDHLPKLVYSCRALDDAMPDPRFRAAAAAGAFRRSA